MNECKDCDSDCYDIEDKQHCYDYRPDRGYCPFLQDVELLDDKLFEL